MPLDSVREPLVMVTPEAAVVVPENEGFVGMVIVTVDADPLVAIWFAVPAKVMTWLDGAALPDPQVKVPTPVPPDEVVNQEGADPEPLLRRVFVLEPTEVVTRELPL